MVELVEAHRAEIASLTDALTDSRAEIVRLAESYRHTVQAQRDSDVSDLFELQAAVDTGMGRLRSDVAAARGILDASSLGPLRSDVRALEDQIVALKRSVESVRRKTSGGATLAPKKAPETAK